MPFYYTNKNFYSKGKELKIGIDGIAVSKTVNFTVLDGNKYTHWQKQRKAENLFQCIMYAFYTRYGLNEYYVINFTQDID